MATYNTSTGTIGHNAASDNFVAPTPQASASDKSAGSIEISSNGSTNTALSINQKSGTVDTSTDRYAQIAASKSGPLQGPISFSKRNGIGGSVADAEADPKKFMFAQGGTRVSLQTALNSGLVKKHSDGNYYDFRVNPASFRKV